MKLLLATLSIFILGFSCNKSYGQEINANNTSYIKKTVDTLSAVNTNIKVLSAKIGLGQNLGNVVLSGASSVSVNNLTGYATDRTTASAPFSFRYSNGTSFIDPTQVRALTSSDVVSLNNSSFSANKSSISTTDVSIPATFRSGFIQLLNATGTITVTTTGGGAFVLNSDFPVISFPMSEGKSYVGYSLALVGGATIQWNLNN